MGKKKERGNGEGDVYPRKNREGKVIGYRGSYWVQTAEGPKRRYVSGKNKIEARAALRKAKSDADGGLLFDAGTLTIEDYLGRWLADSVKDTVRRSTFVQYESVVNRHVVPALGRMKLNSLTPAHVRRLYREKLDSGLSPRTVQYIHVTLHKALKQAVMDGLIPRNVTDAVKAPQAHKKEVKPLSPAEVNALLSAARGDRLEALYVLAIHTGLRRGELLGLRWSDIDLEVGTLSVQRSLGTDGTFNPPKRNKSRRTVKLTGHAVEALGGHRARQNEERMRLGSLWEDHGLVFPNRLGKPMNADNLYHREFKPLLKRAGLSGFTFHSLRHTCATLLCSKNVNPKIVQEMLGHATISQTMDTYSHVMPGMGDVAATALEEALS
ncbi:MAG: site-specific integrase [Actinobacteria bacterium]|nr:MAG: site-specific integrase [Actinomycetota bacterium]